MAGLFDFLKPLIDFLKLYIPVTPPWGTLFIFLLSFSLSAVTALANRFLVDVKLAKSYNEEVKAWSKEFNEARKNNDRKLMAKLNRTKTEIDKAQATISKQRLKITAITFVPFILVFSILSSIYSNTIVAVMPFELPIIGQQLSYYWWYVICSFSTSIPLQKLVGATLD
jgi:uncharacterized membrane protein (DUF106 family)